MPEMNEYEIEMTLISETVLGAGHGGGSGINLDVLRDKDGKHFVKSTTFKGLVREQLEWIASSCGDVDKGIIDSLLGKSDVQAGKLHFWDLESSSAMAKETEVERYATAVDENGVAKSGSLRTFKAIREGEVFFGHITATEPITEQEEKILELAIKCIKHVGVSRTRGKGLVKTESRKVHSAAELSPALDALKRKFGGAN